jgi:thiol-disulfide isomerase/thioredoxin
MRTVRPAIWFLTGVLAIYSPVVLAAPTAIADAEVEAALLSVSMRSLLSELLLWDERTSTWQVARGSQAIIDRPVTVVHVWADWCEPCRDEFPILRDLVEQLPNNVQFISITQTQDTAVLSGFLFRYQTRLPKLPIYQTSRLSDALSDPLARTGLPMPITLVLDHQLVVRTAVVGSLAHRRGGILRSVQRLLALPKGSS